MNIFSRILIRFVSIFGVMTVLVLHFLLLVACTTVKRDVSTDVFIYPIHKQKAQLKLGGNSIIRPEIHWSELVDNDGNAYIFYWKVPTGEEEKFKEANYLCKAEIKDNLFITKRIPLTEIKLSAIEPVNYKSYVNCVKNRNFELNKSEAFRPDGFLLKVFRPLTTTGDYLPVGANYFIRKTGATLKSIVKDVNHCATQVDNKEELNAEERYMSGIVFVSIKSYVTHLRSCLESYMYVVKAN